MPDGAAGTDDGADGAELDSPGGELADGCEDEPSLAGPAELSPPLPPLPLPLPLPSVTVEPSCWVVDPLVPLDPLDPLEDGLPCSPLEDCG